MVLRNYEGYITTYEEPPSYVQHDKAACAYCRNPRPEPGQAGIHGLLQGEAMWIEPAKFEQVHARGNDEQHRLQRPDKWVPYGVGAFEGSSRGPLPVLADGLSDIERAASDTNAGIVEPSDLRSEEELASGNGHRREAQAARSYGPGEEPRPREGEPTASAHGELL